jgi:putative addiction module component
MLSLYFYLHSAKLRITDSLGTAIDKRLREIDSGTAECIPWEDVRSKLYQNANAQD